MNDLGMGKIKIDCYCCQICTHFKWLYMYIIIKNSLKCKLEQRKLTALSFRFFAYAFFFWHRNLSCFVRTIKTLYFCVLYNGGVMSEVQSIIDINELFVDAWFKMITLFKYRNKKKSFKQKTENFIKLSIQNYQNDFQKWFFIDKENNPQSSTFEIQSNWYHSERYFNILNTALTSIHI